MATDEADCRALLQSYFMLEAERRAVSDRLFRTALPPAGPRPTSEQELTEAILMMLALVDAKVDGVRRAYHDALRDLE